MLLPPKFINGFPSGLLPIGGGLYSPSDGGVTPPAPLLPFTDTFERSDGDLGNGWDYTTGIWTIAGGMALGTPTLGSNVTVNGTFDADSNWVKGADWSIGGGVATKVAGAVTTEIAQSVLTVGKWYQADFDLVVNAGSFYPGYFVPGAALFTTSGSKTVASLCASPACLMTAFATSDGTLDNMVYREIAVEDMFCTRDFESSDIDITVKISNESGFCSGIVICLDSYTNPQNFIFALISPAGNRVWLYKCVNGTYTSLVNNSLITYGAQNELRLVKSGTDVSLFYSGIQEGTTQTVSDASIVSNTRHGMFSTYSGNTIGSFTANP